MSIAVPPATTTDCPSPRDWTIPASDRPAHRAALQAAIDACAAAGGGRVVLCPGLHRSGTLVLRSGVTLHLERGATWVGSPRIDDYLILPAPLEGRMLGGVASALLVAEAAEGIGVTGEGTIDGNGGAFFEARREPLDWVEEKRAMGLWIPGFDTLARPRPRALVLFARCRRVRLEDVSLKHSPSWTVHLLACRDVMIAGVTIRGLVTGANTDGIDLDACSDVRVEDCDIETGDDALALKCTNSWGLRQPSRRIAIRRCRLASTTHGFTIGTETQDDFESVTLSDCTIEGAGGHRVLTGIGVDVVDGGNVRHLRMSGITVHDTIAPLHLRLGNAGRGQSVRRPGSIADLVLEHLTIRRASGNCLVAGLPGHRLRDIVLRDVALEFVGCVPLADVVTAPAEMVGEFPPNAAWRRLPAYGLFCRHVEGLELARVAILNRAHDGRPATRLDDVIGAGARDVRVSVE